MKWLDLLVVLIILWGQNNSLASVLGSLSCDAVLPVQSSSEPLVEGIFPL